MILKLQFLTLSNAEKTIFLYFLKKNNLLYLNNDKRISDSTLVATTILIAESKPTEKDVIIDLIMNFLTFDNL